VTIYVDPVSRRGGDYLAVLTADTDQELREAATRLELPTLSHRSQPHPHYLVNPNQRARAVRLGAVAVAADVLASILRRRPTDPTVPWLGVPWLVLVDGNNLLCRAVFAVAKEVPADELAQAGALGFYRMLRKLIRELGGSVECLVCFDAPGGSSWRRDLDASYKQHRPVDPLPLASLALARQTLGPLGITVVQCDGEEADDVLASLVALAPDRPTVLVTTDRDLLQLVSDTVQVLNPAGKPGQRLLGPDQVLAGYGVTPGQWADLRALAGDPSDGIPGLHGVGLRTAARLLAGGRALEQLRGTGQAGSRFGAAIEQSWAQLERWRALIRLKATVAIPTDCRPQGVAGPPLPADPAIADLLEHAHNAVPVAHPVPPATAQAAAGLLERTARLLAVRGWAAEAADPLGGRGPLSLLGALELVLGPAGSRRPEQAAAAAAVAAAVHRTPHGDLEVWERASDRDCQHVQDLVAAAADQLRSPTGTADAAAASGGGGP
jgi:DNA polymerase I